MTSTNQENPEVPEQPKRRQFSAEFKLKILDEIEANPDEVGLILRREGLYSSHLVQWKRWRIKMGEGGAKSLHNENAKLKRENERLKIKLKKAKTIIDIQKKITQMMKEDFPEDNGEKS